MSLRRFVLFSSSHSLQRRPDLTPPSEWNAGTRVCRVKIVRTAPKNGQLGFQRDRLSGRRIGPSIRRDVGVERFVRGGHAAAARME